MSCVPVRWNVAISSEPGAGSGGRAAGRAGWPPSKAADRPDEDLARAGLLGQPNSRRTGDCTMAAGVHGRQRPDGDPHYGGPDQGASGGRPAGPDRVRTAPLAAGEGFLGFLVEHGNGRPDH